MITGDTFDNHKEMYQRAVKIAQVLNEVEGENRVARQMKQKFEYGRLVGQ